MHTKIKISTDTENNQRILKTTNPPFPKLYETIRLNSDSILTINQYYIKIYLCQSICLFMVKNWTFKKQRIPKIFNKY